MRLSKQTNYAVRTLIYCAVNENDLSRIPHIADAFGVSDMFLFKIIHPITKNGMLETVRGRRGGIKLGRPAHEIGLLEVIKVTEENFALSECFGHDRNSCPFKHTCVYTGVLARALDAFFSVIGEYTIADLAHSPQLLESALGIDMLMPRPV